MLCAEWCGQASCSEAKQSNKGPEAQPSPCGTPPCNTFYVAPGMLMCRLPSEELVHADKHPCQPHQGPLEHAQRQPCHLYAVRAVSVSQETDLGREAIGPSASGLPQATRMCSRSQAATCRLAVDQIMVQLPQPLVHLPPDTCCCLTQTQGSSAL